MNMNKYLDVSPEVAQALEREGFSILESAEEKGWCAMAVRR